MPWLLEMTLLVSLLMIPAVLYLAWRLYSSSEHLFSQRRWGLILPILLFSFYLFPVGGLADFYLSGQIDVLKYPKPLTYWFWFGLVFVFQLATWVIIADIIKLGSRYWVKNISRVDRMHAQVLLVLFVLTFILVGWKRYDDSTNIVTDKITLEVEGLPKSHNGFKIVHISDIQGDEYTGRKEIASYIQKVNAQNPGIVIFTGDLVSYGTDFIDMSAEEFGKTRAKYGSFAVVGDHDYWAGVEHIQKALSKQGIPLLRDENRIVQVDSAFSIALTGITHVYSKQAKPEKVARLTAAVDSADIKILASHQVEDHLIASSQKQNYQLLLAGHTHGGQIRVPFMGMNFSAAEQETKYVSGLYREKGLPIHINNGLGFTLGPMRYGAPPTVTVIELRAK